MSLQTSISRPLLPDLHEDIIIETLSCLPVKTLIKFRSVSKSWLCLISNPKLIKSHLVKSSSLNNYSHERIILSQFCAFPGEPGYYWNSSSLHSIFYLPFDRYYTNNIRGYHAAELDYPSKDRGRPVSIVGSCNGLVCIEVENNSIFIWNPSTRESKEVPVLGMSWSLIFGFGYDEITDDYKVVWTETAWKEECVGNGGFYSNTYNVVVYSLKTSAWRQIGDFPRNTRTCHCAGILLNGVLHWATDFYSGNIIVSLDLKSETYGKIAKPINVEGDSSWTLSVLKGYLCVCCNFATTRADIWVMKEYGIRDSWIKMCTIPYMTDPIYRTSFCGRYYDLAWCIPMAGEILVKNGNSLVLYDPKNGMCTNFKVCNLSNPLGGLGVATYVESLVSRGIYEELQGRQD